MGMRNKLTWLRIVTIDEVRAEAEESQLLEAITREWLVKTEQTEKT
jgi:hypothetical protein